MQVNKSHTLAEQAVTERNGTKWVLHVVLVQPSNHFHVSATCIDDPERSINKVSANPDLLQTIMEYGLGREHPVTTLYKGVINDYWVRVTRRS
jgi:hypothetical protein